MKRTFLRYGGPELFAFLLVLVLWLAVSVVRATGAEMQCGPGGCRIPQQQAPAPQIGANTLYPMIVQLRVGGEGRYCYGTGTLVGRGENYGAILTCRHLFRGSTQPIKVAFPGGKVCAGKLAALASGADLAVVGIPRPDVQSIAIATAKPRLGDQLTFAGYDHATNRLRTQRGAVVGFGRESGQDGAYMLLMTGGAIMGNSGGPVLNERGELVAVLSATTGRTSAATHNGRIYQFTANDRFVFPWNADLANQKDARRNPPPQPPPLVPVPPPTADLSGLVERVNRLEVQVGTLEKLRGNPEAIARSAAEAGVKAESAAAGAKAAAEAVEKVESGLSDRIRGVVGKVVGPLVARLGGWGFGIAGVIVGAVIWLVRRDILDKVRTGDPLMIEKLAARTPISLDDKIAELIGGAVDRVAARKAARK